MQICANRRERSCETSFREKRGDIDKENNIVLDTVYGHDLKKK